MSLLDMCPLATGLSLACEGCPYLRDDHCPGEYLQDMWSRGETNEESLPLPLPIVHNNEVVVGEEPINGALIIVRLSDKASKVASHKASYLRRDMRIREGTKRMVYDNTLVLKDTDADGMPAYVRVRRHYTGGHHSR